MTQQSWWEFLLRVFWYGGSTFDAWLNISSAKMSARILTIPQSSAQMGLASAIPYQLFQLGLGLWVQRMLNALYLKCNSGAPSRNFKTSVQLHEIIGGLLGPRWKAVSFILNFVTIFYVSSIQIINSANIAYVFNNTLDKRAWTSVFAAIFSLSIFIPNAHNYRIWSFIGVVSTIFVSAYFTTAAITLKQEEEVKYTSPHSYQEYYRGISGLINLGHVVIPIEIMDAMWKPEEYTAAYAYSQLYLLFVIMVPTIVMSHKFGDKLVDQPNAFSRCLFQGSKYRDAAMILLLVHLFINFGMFALAVYAIWEKLLRVHDSPSYAKRIIWRIPVFLAFWFAALAVPVFGTINKMVDASLVIWNFYIIPCVAYNVFFWSRGTQHHSTTFTTFRWVIDISLNIGVILWLVVVECGLALWGNIASIDKDEKLQFFAKCYSCNTTC